MCRYCNFDVPLHYLLNGIPLLDEIIDADNDFLDFQQNDSDSNVINITEEIASESKLNEPEILEAAAIPKLTIDDVQTTDSSVGRELTFTVKLNAVSSQTVTVDYTTVDDTAVAGEDYLATNGTITFAPGETQKTISVNTTGTSYLDSDEYFNLDLSNATNATIEDNRGQGAILPAYAGIRGWSRQQEVVTFSFFDEDIFGQGGYDGSNRESNAREVSERVKARYREIFEHLNTIVDRDFMEVSESESIGDIRIVVSDAPDYAYAGGHIHLAGWAAGDDAGINGWESDRGMYGYGVLMHELGHALGMPHSFGKDTSVFDPEENSSNTVMSYTFPGSHPATFMAYDIKSLQERYGAAEYRPEDTVYEFVTVDNYLVDGAMAIDTTRRIKQTIWDSGGIDTFDFSGLAIDDSGYRFDLNQSKYQTTQDAYQGASYNKNDVTYYVPDYGTSIAIDTEIENLINSSSDDLIIANSAANIFSGYGLGLTTGNDVLVDTDSLDTLDLSEFSFLDIAEIALEVDRKIELGVGNSITIRDYYSMPQENRINILLDSQKATLDDVYDIVEEDDSVKLANFTVSLAEASSEPISINYTTSDRTAKAGTDYVAQTGTVTFDPGETSKTIAVEILGDTAIEPQEDFAVNLLGNYGQTIAQSIGLIGDNDNTLQVPAIIISDAVETDGNNEAKAIFTVDLDRSHLETITVDYTTLDGLAVAGEDYVAANGTLTFAPGETQKTVTVDLISDRLSGRDEDFQLKLSNVSSNAAIVDDTGIGSIIDPLLQVGLTGGREANLQLASYPPDLEKDPNNLDLEVSSDHSSLTIQGNGNGWKEIPLGEYIGTDTKPLNPYSVIEFDFKSTTAGTLHGIHFEGSDHHDFYRPWEEGRFFQLYGSSEFGIQDFNDYQDSFGEWKTYQIPVHEYFDTTNYRRFGEWIVFAHEGNSDESNTQFRNLQIKELLRISVAGVTVNEEDGVASFTLTLPEVSQETIILNYVTADGNAVAGQDYTAANGTVTFDPGETEKTIEIAIENDDRSETEESFNLIFSDVSNAIAIEPEVTATIVDNEIPLPKISVADLSLDEGNTDTSTASISLSLEKSWFEPITVDYSTSDRTAQAALDYQAVSGTVTFAPGETNKTIDVTVNGDAFNEDDESFWFDLDNTVNAVLERTQAEVTINNDDALPEIDVSDAAVLSSIPITNDEGKTINTTGLLFEVSLDAPSNQTVRVNYATADGTAIADEDYIAKNKVLTFKAGETVKNVFIEVALDDVLEVDETVYLDFTNPVNATLTRDRAIGTIEEMRSLSVSDVEVSQSSTEALFTVSLDQPSVQGVFVDYATVDGSAQAGIDYNDTKGRLFIKAGETSATVAVPLIDNNFTAEDNFFLNLSQPNYVAIADDLGQATIVNDSQIQHIGEVGRVSQFNHHQQTIELNHTYTNPVVFAMPLSYNGSDPAIARITNVRDDSFSVYLQEPEYRDGDHVLESFSYLVLEAGTWELADGDILEVGTIETNGMTTSKWEKIDFAADFDLTPAILSQVQSENGSQFVRTRQKSSSVDGFQLTMEEEEALRHSGHMTETLGWLAIESGSGSWNGLEYQAERTGVEIDHTWDTIDFEPTFDTVPNLLTSLSSFRGRDSAGLRYCNLDTTEVQLKVEEDRSLDNETWHVNETVDFLAIAGSGDLTAVAYDSSALI